MNRQLFKKMAWCAFFLLLAISCGEKADDTEEKIDEVRVPKGKIKAVVNKIPKPSKIPYLLEQSGADYNQTLINDYNNADQYLTSSKKSALNLGIYAVDLGYASIYEKTQNAIDYMKAAKKLSDKLGISASFGTDIIERFKENINNTDSLILIVDSAIQNSDQYLRNNDRDYLAGLVLTGAFIEGLYISTGLVEKYPKNVPKNIKDQVLISLIKVIIDQQNTLENVISILEADKDNEELLKKLRNLDRLYIDMNMQEKIKNNKGNLIVTDKDLIEFTTAVKEIREDFVSY